MSSFSYPNEFTPCFGGCSWAIQEDTEGWKSLYSLDTCRSRLQDYWYTKTHNKAYLYTVTNPDGRDISREATQIAVYVGNSRVINLEEIHKIEEEAGVSLTKTVDCGEVVVFIGDKAWQSTAWKISLYSYFISCLATLKGIPYDSGYGKVFRQNENLFLSRIKDFNEEIFMGNDYISIHVYSGFVSIALAKNPVMTKLLRKGKEKKDE